jgi:hypothetical protein
MKISEVIARKDAPISETTAGATSAGGVATSIGGAAGFGPSPFYKTQPKRKKVKAK